MIEPRRSLERRRGFCRWMNYPQCLYLCGQRNEYALKHLTSETNSNMLKSIHFHNLKALRNTTLPLEPLTVMVGPNGSGKSTVLGVFRDMQKIGQNARNNAISLPAPLFSVHATDRQEKTRITFAFDDGYELIATPEKSGWVFSAPDQSGRANTCMSWFSRMKVLELEPRTIASANQLVPNAQLMDSGGNLAVVLDQLRDASPERFDQLNSQLSQWLPDYNRILFETTNNGHRAFQLRTVQGYAMPAMALSDGTLLAILFLTLAYLPTPPTAIAFEEPDRGIHPSLLRLLRDALHRLAYPDQFNEVRAPIQVIATTHSPYFVDQFKEHPEEIVVANKDGLDVTFERLDLQPNILDVIQDTSLGEAWYSGILGGVPTAP